MRKKMLMGILFLFLVIPILSCEMTQVTTTTTTTASPANEILAIKDETIYLDADFDGSVRSMVAVSRLSEVLRGLYVDQGSFVDAIDLSGSATILIQENGLYLPIPENQPEHYYRATLEEGYEPPFLIAIEYRQNGVEASPLNVLESAAGHVISVHVEANPFASEAFQGGYLCALQIALDSSLISMPAVDGGLVVLAGGEYQISLTVLPGSSSDFDIEFTGMSFGIRSIQATFTRFSPAFFGSDLSGLVTSMPTLIGGIGNLAEGTESLRQGLEQLSDATQELSLGAADIAFGLTQLMQGLGQAAAAAHDTADSLVLLAQTAQALEQGETALANAYAGLLLQLFDVQTTFSALHPGDIDLLTKLATMMGTAQAIETALTDHLAGVTTFSLGLSTLADQYQLFALGLDALYDAAVLLASGQTDLSSGLVAIGEALAELPSAVQSMTNALTAIASGFTAASTSIDFLSSEPGAWVSFTSANNPAPRSVQFIYIVTGF